MSNIAVVEVYYYAEPNPEKYELAEPPKGKDLVAEFEGVAWGFSRERIVLSCDPREAIIDKVIITVTDAGFASDVGVKIASAVPGSTRPIYGTVTCPADGETASFALSVKKSPGWTLKVTVKKKIGAKNLSEEDV